MSDKVKQSIIKKLIRKDYGFPIFQRFLAELVYETKRYNDADIYDRYDQLLKVILGNPKRKIDKQGNVDDEESLRRVMELMGPAHNLKKTPVCESVARSLVFSKDKENSDNSTIHNGGHQKIQDTIDSHKKRLLNKLNSKGASFHANKHLSFHMQLEIDEDPENNFKESQLVQSFFSLWSKKYGS